MTKKTLEKRIEAFETAKQKMRNSDTYHGICTVIWNYDISTIQKILVKYIPKRKWVNSYIWERNEYGKRKRIALCNRIIRDCKTELKKLKGK